jgi:hypothetical protein
MSGIMIFWRDVDAAIPIWGVLYLILTRVSFETSFDSKQSKLEPKLVSALSETNRSFRLFRFYTETASFGVSIEPKQQKINQNKQKQTEMRAK